MSGFFTGASLNQYEVAVGGTGTVSNTLHGLLYGNGTSPIGALAELSNGQLAIGSTGNAPVAATLTQGSGISITNASGSITIASTVSGTVTSITAGTGITLSPSTITTTGSVSLTVPVVVSSGGTGLITVTAKGMLYGNGTSAFGITAALTDGQVVIGSTSGNPTASTLTAGTGINISNGSGSITINATGVGTTIEVTGISASMAVNDTYIANNASLVTLTLPATAAIGDVIKVRGKGAGGYSIAQNSSQQIIAGTVSTTIGVTGAASNTQQYDGVDLICIVANTTFSVSGAWGALNYV